MEAGHRARLHSIHTELERLRKQEHNLQQVCVCVLYSACSSGHTEPSMAFNAECHIIQTVRACVFDCPVSQERRRMTDYYREMDRIRPRLPTDHLPAPVDPLLTGTHILLP